MLRVTGVVWRVPLAGVNGLTGSVSTCCLSVYTGVYTCVVCRVRVLQSSYAHVSVSGIGLRCCVTGLCGVVWRIRIHGVHGCGIRVCARPHARGRPGGNPHSIYS